MRRMILPLMLLVVACRPGQLSEEQRLAIMDELGASVDGWWDAWRATDFDRAMTYLYHHPMTVFGTEGRTVEGFATIDSVLRPAFATVASQEVNIDGGSRFFLTQDAVYVMDYGTYSVTDTSGATGPTRPFVCSSAWRLTDKGWKIFGAHVSEGDPVTE